MTQRHLTESLLAVQAETPTMLAEKGSRIVPDGQRMWAMPVTALFAG